MVTRLVLSGCSLSLELEVISDQLQMMQNNQDPSALYFASLYIKLSTLPCLHGLRFERFLIERAGRFIRLKRVSIGQQRSERLLLLSSQRDFKSSKICIWIISTLTLRHFEPLSIYIIFNLISRYMSTIHQS